MAKKTFIRHLEFYGFPDQNVYNGITNVDLSDIYETNKEQDKEISEISGETNSKADLSLVNELSGKVDSFIGIQSGINESFLESISGITDNIESLKERDIEITDKINEITDSINDLAEGIELNKDSIDEVSGKVDTIEDFIEGLDNVLSGIEESIDSIEEELDKKLDSDVAEETYAKKDDVYTKEEADETFLKEHQSLDWVRDDIDVLSGAIDTLQEEIDNLPDTSKFVKKEEFEEFEGIYSAYTASTDNTISIMSSSVDSLSSSVSILSSNIESVSAIVDTKLDKTTFNDYTNEIDDRLDDFNAKKADASALTATNTSLANLSGVVNNEISERVASDASMNGRIDTLNERVDSLNSTVNSLSGTVESFDDRLTQEIEDRKAGDIALIGASSDTRNANTIWGAKKYASYQKTLAVNQAKEYTDDVFSGIETEIANKFDEIETDIAKKADKTYVDATVNEKVGEAYETLDEKIDIEKDRAIAKELNLQSQINEIIASGSSAAEFEKVYKRLNVITTYSGDSAESYVNTGNGVLDVLHREFHEFEKTAGAIKEIRVEDDNLIIVYYTKDGEKESVIPISDLVDLSNYYTKDETDERIQEAIDETILDNFYTKDETDAKINDAVSDVDDKIEGKVDTSAFTEAISSLDERVSNNTSGITDNASAIASLFDKLGYTNNDTLVTTNRNEVAFGEYNISNTSEHPSGQTAFSIGIGTSDLDRRNAVEVMKDGTVYMWIEGDYMSVNDLLSMLAHETYN